MKTSSIFKSAFLTLIFAFLFNAPSYACLEIPTDPPDTEVDSLNENTARVTLLNYTTYGSTPGEYCACALNIPLQFGIVISAEIVAAGTLTPINGWSFGSNSNTTDSLQIPQGEWQGFSSAVSAAIASGIEVDLVFIIDEFGIDAAAGPSNANVLPFDFQGLLNHLRTTNPIVVTGGSNPQGNINSHVAILPAGTVTYNNFNQIPTLSEWGLILLTLLLLTFGTIKIGQRQQVLAFAGNTYANSSIKLPMNRGIFSTFTLVMLGLLLVFGGLYWFLIETPSLLDMVGAVVATVLLAYLFHLWRMFR